MARKSSKPVSTPKTAKPVETPESELRCYQKEAPRFERMAVDENGQSLWEVHSLNPWVDRKDPPMLVQGVTFDEAVNAMRAAGATQGPNALVMWPAWAFYPEWSMENETLFHEIMLVYQQRQIAVLQAELAALRVVSPKSVNNHSTVSGRPMPKGIA